MWVKKNYKKTQLACYLGFVTQAICANFVPLLFITFHSDYDISFSMLALISTCFFFGSLTPKSPESLEKALFFRQIKFCVYGNTVIYVV